ncbi:MAG: hypothetical protein WEF86_08925 [Gemmatimonadota bacterium]
MRLTGARETQVAAVTALLIGFALGTDRLHGQVQSADTADARAEVSADTIAQQFVGCYDVDVGPWSPHEPSDSIYYMPPARMQLSLAVSSGGLLSQGYAVEPAPGAMPSIHRYSSWNAAGPGALTMSWSTGFAGMHVRLSGRDTLTGELRAFTDVVGVQRYTAGVRAVRVDCDAALDPSRRRAWRYPPIVRLASGDSLMLGTAPPAHLNVLPGPSGYVLETSPLPPYHDAKSVTVHMRDGVVSAVVLQYPDEVEFDTLLVRLTRELGPPTSVRQTDWRWAAWSARLVSISVQEDTFRIPGLRIQIQRVRP